MMPAMSTKKQPPEKTPTLLDEMVPHVSYEVEHVLDFVAWGNGCCVVLHPSLAKLTSESLLEAALIHLRRVIEFLAEKQLADQVRARDYLPNDWNWAADRAEQVDDIHDRVAHLGLARAAVGKTAHTTGATGSPSKRRWSCAPFASS
jgi:hypothetical protein